VTQGDGEMSRSVVSKTPLARMSPKLSPRETRKEAQVKEVAPTAVTSSSIKHCEAKIPAPSRLHELLAFDPGKERA